MKMPPSSPSGLVEAFLLGKLWQPVDYGVQQRKMMNSYCLRDKEHSTCQLDQAQLQDAVWWAQGDELLSTVMAGSQALVDVKVAASTQD